MRPSLRCVRPDDVWVEDGVYFVLFPMKGHSFETFAGFAVDADSRALISSGTLRLDATSTGWHVSVDEAQPGNNSPRTDRDRLFPQPVESKGGRKTFV